MRKVLLIGLLICALTIFAHAQFNSGSTGADGALDLSTMTCPNNICEVQLPESGILNYTTVNIPQGKILKFKLNSLNTPVILLAQGNILIDGIIEISSSYTVAGLQTKPGPGGYYGGEVNQNGYGPGGGVTGSSAIVDGRWVGSFSLVPIIGGSGGAGSIVNAGTGTGGGGAIAIASSSLIVVGNQGRVFANSGVAFGTAGTGSGGAIRMVANSITIRGRLEATATSETQPVRNGMIRLEAPQGQIDFTGSANPTPVFAQINPVIIPIDPPTLRIASIGGYAVPSYSAGRPDRIDLMLPTQLADPIQVQIQGSNVPSGTDARLQLSGSSGTATGCTLTGGPGPVACNATVSGLNRNGVSTLLAVAVFTPPPLAQVFNPKGQNQVSKVRLESKLGGKSKFTFLRANGSVINLENLSLQFLQQFGM